ncbi:unnamed protein product [Caenorhabditis auriculariae]|uniref:Uncharacterized protein n=1 Tax=Caenorhabditis auriculariae TaxID=2777116 RepID=A0A8S1H6L6_9PELO|nr:unnamed protein product [Caenorhabditis auriculariae]
MPPILRDIKTNNNVNRIQLENERSMKSSTCNYEEQPKKGEEEEESYIDVLPNELLGKIVNHSIKSPRTLLTLKSVSRGFEELVQHEISAAARINPIAVDVYELFSFQNPFKMKVYDSKRKNEFFNSVRRLCTLLETLERIGSRFSLENLKIESLGWIDYSLTKVRCPYLLQRRLRDVLNKFDGTSSWTYFSHLFRPSRFFAVFSHCLERITSLDLKNIRNLKSLKLRKVFEKLSNLKELTWHNASLPLLKVLSKSALLKKLVVTVNHSRATETADYEFLANFKDLEEFSFGISSTADQDSFARPTVQLMEEIYERIWSKKAYENATASKGNLLNALPSLTDVTFWRSPRKIFADLLTTGNSYNSVSFGGENISSEWLCPVPNFLESLMFFEESERPPPDIKCLNLFLKNTLQNFDLPFILRNFNRMDRLEKLKIKVDNCCFISPQETTRKNQQRGFYSEFSLDIERVESYNLVSFEKILNDLPGYLSSGLQKFSLSLRISEKESMKNRVLAALRALVKKISCFNNFPDLEELNLTVWGPRCLKELLEIVSDCTADFIKRCSVVCKPNSEQEKDILEALGKFVGSCKKLEKASFSAETLRPLIEKVSKSYLWREILREKTASCGFGDCRLEVVPKLRQDFQHEEEESDGEPEVEEKVDESEYGSDEESDEEFVVRDEKVEMSDEESELDVLEKKLNGETERRHKRWKRLDVASSPEPEEESDEPEESLDEMDEEEEEPLRNPFLDEEAVETDGSESVDDEEQEQEPDVSEDSDIDFDDQRLFDNDVRRLNEEQKRPKRRAAGNAGGTKRRRVIVSDSDED